MNSNHNLAISTVMGTLLSVSYIEPNDILKSAVLAAIGATVSLTVSLLLRFLLKKAKEKFGP